jgi:ribosome-binding protein aMBF1 (putative translation factor)
MDKKTRKRLEAAGWKVGSVAEFLDLTAEEAAMVEARYQLAKLVRERRVELGISQKDLATRLGSDQGRVSKIESADASVSLDLLFRAAFALGAEVSTIGQALSEAQP